MKTGLRFVMQDVWKVFKTRKKALSSDFKGLGGVNRFSRIQAAFCPISKSVSSKVSNRPYGH
jgi:hypothetical protein